MKKLRYRPWDVCRTKWRSGLMSYLNCCKVYLRISWKLKICTLRSFTIVYTTKQEFQSSSRAIYCWYSSSDNERKFEMVFYDCFFAQMDFMLKVHAVINLAHSEKEWSNFVQVTLKIIYSSLPCHASLLSSGCLEWDVHTLPLFNMLIRPKINYRDAVDEWRGWFLKKFWSCIGGIWGDTQKFGHRVDCIGHRRFKDWEADVRVLGRSQGEMTSAKGPVIIYRLGGGGRILGGITWFLGEQKGGSVVTEFAKRGITESFVRIQRGNY